MKSQHPGSAGGVSKLFFLRLYCAIVGSGSLDHNARTIKQADESDELRDISIIYDHVARES